jgi:P-type Ca2+ transporter type 2C
LWFAESVGWQVLLSFAAAVAFALGLFQDFGPNHQPGEPRVDWVEGVAIMIAVLIVVRLFVLNIILTSN